MIDSTDRILPNEIGELFPEPEFQTDSIETVAPEGEKEARNVLG